MRGKDLLSIADLNGEDVHRLLRDALKLKAGGWLSLLRGKTLAIMFEKPSLRTRVSFELAMRQLGGEAIYLSPAEVGLGKRESVADVARVLERYVSAIAARTYAHETVVGLAKWAHVPVINALSDYEHPCQALADLLTMYEKKGRLSGLNLAYIGDGNNVANSLLLGCALAGVNFRIAAPPGYEIPDSVMCLARGYGQESGAGIVTTEVPRQAVKDADIIYTDVWTSMGQEAEAGVRRRVFAAYQLNEALVALARNDAILMHPLPAHRGEEVSETVLDGPQSVVFDQAENRLHVQKALLAMMLGGREPLLAD